MDISRIDYDELATMTKQIDWRELERHQTAIRIASKYNNITVGSVVIMNTWDLKDWPAVVTDISIDRKGNIAATVSYTNKQPRWAVRKISLKKLRLA